jgi:hypothetical protein
MGATIVPDPLRTGRPTPVGVAPGRKALSDDQVDVAAKPIWLRRVASSRGNGEKPTQGRWTPCEAFQRRIGKQHFAAFKDQISTVAVDLNANGSQTVGQRIEPGIGRNYVFLSKTQT